VKTTLLERAIVVLAAAALAGVAGCWGTVSDDGAGVGVVDGGGASYSVGLYEPPGYVYGGWSSGYHVGPPRGDGDRGDRDRGGSVRSRGSDGGNRAGTPAYRPAPQSRPVPSLPSRRRSR